MKNFFASIKFVTLITLFVLTTTSTVYADSYEWTDPCTQEIGLGGCVMNFKCIITDVKKDANEDIVYVVGKSETPNCNSSSIGAVESIAGIRDFDLVANYQTGNSNNQSIGIIVFLSNLIKVFAIITGIWAMFNFIKAGYTLITSMSDAGAMEKVKNSITMTVIGLTIIASAYIIAAVAGALLFGDPGFILNPTLQGALQ